MRFKVSFVAVAVLALASASIAQGQGQGRRGGQFGRGGGQRLTQLLRNPQVQTELKVTDEQKTKIEALPSGRGPGGGGPGGGGGGGQRGNFTPPTVEEQLKQFNDDKATTSAILTADQEKRLEELRIQWAGPRAATFPDVQATLALTDDQKKQITDLVTKMNAANRGLMEKAQNGEIDRQDVFPTMQKNNETLGTEIEKVLTADQKTKLKALGGAELKQEMPQRRGGGRRGNG